MMTTIKEQLREICSFSEEKLAMLAIIDYVNGCDEDSDPEEFMSEIEDLKDVDEDKAKMIKYDRIEEKLGYLSDPHPILCHFTDYIRLLDDKVIAEEYDDWENCHDGKYFRDGTLKIEDDRDTVNILYKANYRDDQGHLLVWTAEEGWFNGQYHYQKLQEIIDRIKSDKADSE
jgi:hypothetical protein